MADKKTQQPTSLILVLSIIGIIVTAVIVVYALLYQAELSNASTETVTTPTDDRIEAPEITTVDDLDTALDTLNSADIDNTEEQELLDAKVKEFQE